jgi:hypothetical protein
MSADAKVWQDHEGWHSISDWNEKQITGSHYQLSDIITQVEDSAGQSLYWEIFQFGNGFGLRGYRAKHYEAQSSKVYILFELDYDLFFIYGVYSTRERAECAQKNLKPHWIDSSRIEEVELDIPNKAYLSHFKEGVAIDLSNRK